jgi:hypothetical protein
MIIFHRDICGIIVETARDRGYDVHYAMNIALIDGNLAPTLAGQRTGFYDKRTSEPTSNTSAFYSVWGTTTCRIEVGKDWLFENLPENLRTELFCNLAGIK